jgi:hypothetical protein
VVQESDWVRIQAPPLVPKWRARSVGSSTTYLFLSSSDPTIKEEVTRPIGRDITKADTRKRKEKEGSSS